MQLHTLMVPFHYSEGHITGMLRLAQALATMKGVLVTFAYPARFHSLAQNRDELSATRSSLQSCSMLRVVVVEDGLPLEEEHALTQELVHLSMSVFQNAIKLLLDGLINDTNSSSVSALPPLRCIISDTFTPWVQDLANAVGLPRVDFWTSTAAFYSMGSQLSRLVSSGTLPLPKGCWSDPEKKWSAEKRLIEGIPGLPTLPATDFPVEFVQPEDVSDFRLQFMLAAFACIREAHTILVHSVYELESQVFDALQAFGLPVYPVGPLLDSPLERFTTEGAKKHESLQWLDQQPPSSVIYIALGSVAKFTSTEMCALALGLEASAHRFLWVIRRDSISGSLSEALPEGFLQRTAEKGMGLIISWSPQMEVLRHSSVGAFFSHCGWNSTLECMWEGVPMVACPRAGEQRSNAKWVVENWKMGVELERQHDGSFTKEAVESALKQVLSLKGEKGLPYKESALHWKKVVRAAAHEGGTSQSNLDHFFKHSLHSAHCN